MLPNPSLADQLQPYLEQVGNDACNAEDPRQWRTYLALRDTIAYLRSGDSAKLPQETDTPPWLF